MAPPPPSLFLLLLLLLLLLNPYSAAAVSIASPPSRCPSQSPLPPLPPLSPSQAPSPPSLTHSQAPPPPPPLSPLQPPPPPPPPLSPPPPPLFRLPTPTTRATPQQMDSIVDALIGSGDFGSWINTITTANPITLPLSATVFVPENLAAAGSSSSSRQNQNPNPNPPDPFLLPYHVVPQRLTITDLRLFKTGSRLPTLLPGKSILVTANSDSNFTLDGADVTQPDVYVTANVVVHGVVTVLDYAVYGDATTTPPKQECPPPPPPPSPPEEEEDDEALPAAVGGGVLPNWTAGGVRAQFPVGVAAACVALLLRYRIL